MEDWQRRIERRRKKDGKRKEKVGLHSSSSRQDTSRSTKATSKQSSIDPKRLKEAQDNAAADRGLRLIQEMNLKMKRTCFVDSSTLFSSPEKSPRNSLKPFPKKPSRMNSFYNSDSDQEFTSLEKSPKNLNLSKKKKSLKKPSPLNSGIYSDSDEEFAMLGARINQRKIEKKKSVANQEWKETKSKQQTKPKRKSISRKNLDSDEDSIDSMDRKPRAKPDLFKGHKKHDSDSDDSSFGHGIPLKSIMVHKILDDDGSYDSQEGKFIEKQKRHSPDESIKKAHARQVRREESSDDSNSDEDMMAYSRRIRKTDKKSQYSSSESEHEDEEVVQSEQSPSFKNQDSREKKEHKRKSLSTRTSKNKNKPSPMKQKPNDVLWSDDDAASSGSSIQDTDNKSTSAMNDWDEAIAYINKSPSPVKKKRNKKQSKKKVRPSKEFDDYDSEVDEFADEAALEQKLKPHFEKPKWLSECIPLPLKNPLAEQDGDGNQEQAQDAAAEMKHSIPASINRYLKVYQQEGVRFIYKLLMQGYGSVLGDDMGKYKNSIHILVQIGNV